MHIFFQNNQYLGSYYFTRSADDPVSTIDLSKTKTACRCSTTEVSASLSATSSRTHSTTTGGSTTGAATWSRGGARPRCGATASTRSAWCGSTAPCAWRAAVSTGGMARLWQQCGEAGQHAENTSDRCPTCIV